MQSESELGRSQPGRRDPDARKSRWRRRVRQPICEYYTFWEVGQLVSSGALLDPAAAEHDVTVVKDRALPRCDRPLRLVEHHLHTIVCGIERRGRPGMSV